jgi:2-furoyl-CoA dehydrogenase large subunit
METPSPFTPLGAKGIGEGSNMSTPVCVANAIADALGAAVDPEKIVLPLTPSNILALLGPPDTPPGRRQQASAHVATSAREDVGMTVPPGPFTRALRWLRIVS